MEDGRNQLWLSAARFLVFSFVALGIMGLQFKQYEVMRSMASGLARAMEGEVTTTWTSGGVQRSVTTNRLPTETDEEWRTRHFGEVTKQQHIYPPD